METALTSLAMEPYVRYMTCFMLASCLSIIFLSCESVPSQFAVSSEAIAFGVTANKKRLKFLFTSDSRSTKIT